EGEGAGRNQAGMTERNLAGVAGEQHQRKRADRGEKNLAGKIERERRGDEREGDQRGGEEGEAIALEPGADERELLRVAGAEISAPSRRPRHGRAPRACRTGPRAER